MSFHTYPKIKAISELSQLMAKCQAMVTGQAWSADPSQITIA